MLERLLGGARHEVAHDLRRAVRFASERRRARLRLHLRSLRLDLFLQHRPTLAQHAGGVGRVVGRGVLEPFEDPPGRLRILRVFPTGECGRYHAVQIDGQEDPGARRAERYPDGPGRIAIGGQGGDQAGRRPVDRLAVGAQREVLLVVGAGTRPPGEPALEVIAQQSLERLDVVTTPLGLEQLARAALPPLGDPGRHVAVAVGSRQVDATVVPPPALRTREGLEVSRADLPVRAEVEVIGERVEGGPPSGPAAVGGLEDPGLSRVGEQEAVVVAGRARREGRSALAVALDQRGDHLQRLARIAAALQAQPHQVHADQPGPLLDGLVGEDRLVADRDAVLVHAVLEAPDPIGRVAHHAVGLGDLGDLDVRAAHPGLGRVARLGVLDEGLALAALAVAVLREEGGARSRLAPDGHHGIAHGLQRTRGTRHGPAPSGAALRPLG